MVSKVPCIATIQTEVDPKRSAQGWTPLRGSHKQSVVLCGLAYSLDLPKGCQERGDILGEMAAVHAILAAGGSDVILILAVPLASTIRLYIVEM